jgi:hypothetical protein
MAQTFTEDSFAAGHAGLTDLQNMENNFLALKTLFSGSSAPSNSTGGMPWFDTAKKILKLRDSTNGAWLGVHYSGSASRWWVFAASASDGWVVDSSITDRVVSIRGGTAAWNVTGGSLEGTHTILGLANSTESSDHVHYVDNHTHTFGTINVTVGSSDVTQTPVLNSYTTSGAAFTGGKSTHHTHTIASNGTWRPAAAVGTLQYLDL